MWIIMAACMLALCGSCNSSRQTNDPGYSDSVLLYKQDSLLILGAKPCIIQLQLQNRKTEYKQQRKTLLLFDHPDLVASPDGVYEVRVNDDFVNVLDLYSRSAPDAKDILEVDISKHAEKFFAPGNTQPVYISLHFKGNSQPDGTVSGQTGELRLPGFRIVQVRK